MEESSSFLSDLIQQPRVRGLKPSIVSNCKSSAWVAEGVNKRSSCSLSKYLETELLTVTSQAIVAALLKHRDLNGRFVARDGGWQGGLPACWSRWWCLDLSRWMWKLESVSVNADFPEVTRCKKISSRLLWGIRNWFWEKTPAPGLAFSLPPLLSLSPCNGTRHFF